MSVEFVKGLDRFSTSSKSPIAATIGTFDGIHLGHQRILKRVQDSAREIQGEAVLITFHPHPRVVVTPDNVPPLLTTIEEKEQFIPDFFSGRALILEFNEKLKEMSYEQFVTEVLIEKIGINKLIVGYDHGFGKNRQGSIPELTKLGKRYSFGIEVIDPVVIDEAPVSSSRIRGVMINGEYQQAIRLLGHDYAIFGTVGQGIGLGKNIGYPTANVMYNPRKLLPREGVYACWAKVDNEKKCGMMFIGRNHFDSVERISVEANLFDFDRDIYGQEIAVYPTHYIRENRKFDSTEELSEQIGQDKKEVLRIIDKEKANGNRQGAESSNYC